MMQVERRIGPSVSRVFCRNGTCLGIKLGSEYSILFEIFRFAMCVGLFGTERSKTYLCFGKG